MPAKPIRLYWWSRSNMTNMGDELSRDIVRFVSGRPVERADQETADMLAIGSIIGFPQRAHERTQPYLVWGSGTLENSQRARQEAFAFSAVRGPLTLSTLNNHRTVPFGDPGILTSQL